MSAVVRKWDEAQESQMVKSAVLASQKAYCPYSRYQVGAALLTTEGVIIEGCNFENSAYGSTICAERGALGQAIVKGYRAFLAIAVVTKDGQAHPCGACRQSLNEHSPENGSFNC